MARKTYEVIGYGYEADAHCLTCTAKRFVLSPMFDAHDRDTVNDPHPIFLGDDGSDTYYCGDCAARLDA